MWIGHRLPLKALLASIWHQVLLVLVTASVVTFVYLEYLAPWPKTPAVGVSVLGISLAFFVGFLSVHAYERWWQARSIVGDIPRFSRDFARMVLTFISASSDGGDVQALQKRLIFRHLAVFLAVKARMWHQEPESYRTYLDEEDAVAIEGKDHVPIALLLLQARTLEHCVQSGYLDNYRMVAMSHTLNEITRVVGACDRIKGTPFFPFYFLAVRYTLWVFVVFFPTAIADTAGYWAVLHTFLLGSLMVWLVHSADAVSRPFDRQPSAVALEDCMRTIEIDLLQQLGEEAVPSRVMPVDNLYLP